MTAVTETQSPKGQARTRLAWPAKGVEQSAVIPPGNRSGLDPLSRSAHVTCSVSCPLPRPLTQTKQSILGVRGRTVVTRGGKCRGVWASGWGGGPPCPGGNTLHPKVRGLGMGCHCRGPAATVFGGSDSPATSLLTLACVTAGARPQGPPALNLTAPSLCRQDFGVGTQAPGGSCLLRDMPLGGFSGISGDIISLNYRGPPPVPAAASGIRYRC